MTVKDYIRTQIGELVSVSAHLNEETLETLAEEILSAPSLVLSGVGKAGLIGKKLAATFSSTGTPSIFLDPTDALHGDLGGVPEESMSLLLSHSGETKEVLRLIPHLGWTACLTSKESPLSEAVDRPVIYGKVAESGPLGLAPTSSTTTMLVVGDSLAMRVMELRGFTLEQYANSHPGGSLGGKSTLVDEVMREPVILAGNTTIARIPFILASRHEGLACVLKKDGSLFGIQTIASASRGDDTEINPTTLPKGASVSEAMKLMREKHINQIPIKDGDKIVGVVDIQSLVGLHLDI